VSSTPVPTTEATDPPAPDGAASTVTEEEWKAMKTVLDNVYAYRTEE
jgi:chromatin structure-remodeling complex subunit RSC1/2